MSIQPKTYTTLSTSEQAVYAAVSVSGSTSTRPAGVGILSATPGLSDISGGALEQPTAATGPADIIAAME